jgi:hypothetical protein
MLWQVLVHHQLCWKRFSKSWQWIARHSQVSPVIALDVKLFLYFLTSGCVFVFPNYPVLQQQGMENLKMAI